MTERQKSALRELLASHSGVILHHGNAVVPAPLTFLPAGLHRHPPSTWPSAFFCTLPSTHAGVGQFAATAICAPQSTFWGRQEGPGKIARTQRAAPERPPARRTHCRMKWSAAGGLGQV